ncbi:unnamed protein product [Wuchereria bancrofti]|uniref:Uncharacterized protein n=1 Tax=Wuchereria bancrofti TaxID=6293 RepID=A0A3P7EJE6_WUCBA|nr:unnamed protein product [Wuchereria bancrofti]
MVAEDEINDIIKRNEYLKENTTLLKMYLRSLGDLIPSVQKKEGNNFNEMYATMQIELDKAKAQQIELEKLRKSEQELLEKQKSEFEHKKTQWKEKLMDQEKLYSIITRCCKVLSDLNRNNKLGIAHLAQQKNRCKKLQFKVNKVKMTAEQSREKLIRQEQMFREKLDGMKETHEMALKQRDRTISILTKQLKLVIEESAKAQSVSPKTLVHNETQTVTEFETYGPLTDAIFNDEI